ncbi:MAG: purine-nucleoside phosphorylase [Desulfobacterales bacterium]
MKNPRDNAEKAAAFLMKRIPVPPKIGLFTGTGLGDALPALEVAAAFDYSVIPHFPVPTVQSHPGRLLAGDLLGRPIVLLQGRLHLYEGRSPAEVVFPVRVLQEMGVRCLVATNAAGGLNPAFRAGDIMLIGDHINLTGENPLTGPNDERWGPRFPDMSAAYDRRLMSLAERAAAAAGIALRRGIYAGLKGPSLETPAEIRFLRTIGADAVGFSTVMEVIAAVHGGMRVLGLSVVTNVHDPDRPEPAAVEAIIASARQAAPRIETLLNGVLGLSDDGDLG